MPGRTWVIAPDSESLELRWYKLIHAPAESKEALFHPHLRKGKPGDKHTKRVVINALAGYESNPKPIADEQGACVQPTRYGFRSFDRQWIIPDSRVINQPNPELWASRSDKQIYITAFLEESPTSGPALTFTCAIPDLHHYKGSFGGRVFPLWRDAKATVPNLPPKLLPFLSQKYGCPMSGEDVFAYIAAIAAHPTFTARFQEDLSTPGLKIPFTGDQATFTEAVDLGRTIIWLHTFGDRMVDSKMNRPAQPPRLPTAKMPRIPKAGQIPEDAAAMPDTISYDATKKRLLVGQGYVENVEPGMWAYEVSGKQILLQWFSYRKANRERPIMGDRRPPSPLGNVQPDHWLAAYTTDLINILNVLGRLIELEPTQAKLLERVCAGPLIPSDELLLTGAFEVPAKPKRKTQKSVRPHLFGTTDL
jgi:Type ISP C-terminal specificity domain